jgi:hypothetical protein
VAAVETRFGYTIRPMSSRQCDATCARRSCVLARLATIAAVATVPVVLAPVASAQIAPASPLLTYSTPHSPVATAYDPAHDAFVVVEDFPINSTTFEVRASFIHGQPRSVDAPITIAVAPTQAIRAIYSPDVSDGAGGLGGFLVAWFEPGPNVMRTQLVAYPGRLVGARQTIAGGVSGDFRGVTFAGDYSVTDRLFLLAWSTPFVVATRMARVDLEGKPLGPILPLSIDTAADLGLGRCLERQFTCSGVDVAWNAASREFGVLFHDGTPGSPHRQAVFARVLGNAAVAGRTILRQEPTASARVTCDLEFNTRAGTFPAVLGQIEGTNEAVEIDATGQITARGSTPTPPTPGPAATCLGPDPFVAIGGGVCVAGGWLPIAMIGGGH